MGCYVGFWKATLVSEGSPGIPDGTVIDAGFAQWHSDGTEILNSPRPAASSNFCLRIWPTETTIASLGLLRLNQEAPTAPMLSSLVTRPTT
jgi:hypothetical protein